MFDRFVMCSFFYLKGSVEGDEWVCLPFIRHAGGALADQLKLDVELPDFVRMARSRVEVFLSL